MDREHVRGVMFYGLVAAMLALLIAGSLFLAFARFDECTTVHPWWYCLGGR